MARRRHTESPVPTDPSRRRPDRWVHDDQGNLVVWQKPNLPLIVWIVARGLELVVRRGAPGRLMATIAFGALFTWAWLELFEGASYLRRVLGLVVLAAIVY